MVYFKALAFLFVFLTGLTSCSVLKKQAMDLYLSSAKDKKLELFRFKAPPLAYKKAEHKTLDALWTHEELGASISYFSSCSKLNHSLKAFQSSAYPKNLKHQIIESHKDTKGLYSLLKILEPENHIAIYTKKNGECYVNLNFVAPSKSIFDQELQTFDRFIKEFQFR